MDASDLPNTAPTRQPNQPLIEWKKAVIALPICFALAMPTHLVAEPSPSEPPLPTFANLTLQAGAPLLPAIAAAALDNAEDPDAEPAADAPENAVLLPADGEPLPEIPPDPEDGTCVVFGEVSDETTLDPIPGAIIDAVGTGIAVESDADGKFRFENLPAGTITIEATQLGYFSAVTVVTTLEGQPVEARLGLRARPTDSGDTEYMLDEEVVIGEYQEESQGDLFIDLDISSAVTASISAEDFAKENVSDAGEAVAKVSGANIVDGKFAVVRGLADRYIGTTFNGAQISSAVSDRKAIELDLFPTSAIEAINVAKTYDPHLLGDFGGASIDIRSRFFPKEPFAFLKAKYEYDSDLPDDFRTVPGPALSIRGETSNPLIPTEFTRADPVTGRVSLITSPQNQARDVARRLTATRSSFPAGADPEQTYSYGFGFGRTVEVTDYLDVGILLGHSWKSGANYNESAELRAPERSWYQKEYQKFTEWDLYFAGSARLNDAHEISAVFFRKHVGQNNVITGENLRDPNTQFEFGNESLQTMQGTRRFYGADAEILGGFYDISPQERDLRIIQLSGNSQFGDKDRGPRVRWSLTDSKASDIQPNSTFQEFTKLDFQSPALDRARIEGEQFIINTAESALGLPAGSLDYEQARQAFINNGATAFLNSLVRDRIPIINPSLGQIETLAIAQLIGSAGPGNILTRATQSVRENTTDANIAIDLPYYFSENNEDRGFELGLGASAIDRTRQIRGSRFQLLYEDLSAGGTVQGGFQADDFMPSTDADGDGLSNLAELLFTSPERLAEFLTGNPATGPFFRDASNGSDNFAGLIANNANANHDYSSWFISGNLFWGNTFLRGGLRHESEERRAEFVEPKPLGEQDPAPINQDTWLPSVTMGTSFLDDKLSLTGAWSRTAARPTFFEWVPTRSFDLSTGFIRAGNPALENSQITNIDLSIQYAPDPDRLFRVSFFSKEIVDPIIGVRVPGVADAISFINGDVGTISGVEIESEFSNIGPFSLKTNLTYIDAALDYEFNDGQIVSGNFPYQPTWISNVNLGYENEDMDLGVNLIYNFTGEYATLLRTTPNFPNVIRERQHSLDLVIRKGFDLPGDSRLAVSLGVENLWTTDETFVFEGGSAAIDGQTRGIQQRDRVFFAELKYEF